MSVDELIFAIRRDLAAVADPSKAPKMRAYMKSSMPYLGVPAPAQKAVLKPLFREHVLTGQDEWLICCLRLWREAEFREERYAAIELTGHRVYDEFQNMTTVPMYEEMIVDGAWWDYVDAVAVQRIGKKLLVRFPKEAKPLMRRWSVSADMWKRRSSIICQVGLKHQTDLRLLYACIEANLDHKDFFIRKAIGWALRSYAWVDPAEIKKYVAMKGNAMSALSRREATKNI